MDSVQPRRAGGVSRGVAVLSLAALALAGCASARSAASPAAGPTLTGTPLAARLGAARGAAPAVAGSVAATPAMIDALVPADPVDVTLPPQPLPQLINTVFGAVLELPYAMGPGVGDRTDTVSLRTAPGMTKRSLFRQVQAMLDGYGLKVRIRDGAVQIVAAGDPTDALTLSGRAEPQTPEAARRLTQVYRASAVAPEALTTLMADVFPQTGDIGFSADPAADSVTVSGSARQVATALSVLEALDQPRFAGVSVVRAQPVYWSAESLAAALRDSLGAEGFRMSDSPMSARSVFVLAVPGANQLLVFARDPAALQRARTWISQLDRPEALGGRVTTFIYQVRNTDAATLADLVTAARGQADATRPALQAGQPGQPPLDTAALNEASAVVTGGFGEGRLAVDDSGNRIVFTGSADDFMDLRSLLVALDTPRPQVLVEVTVAEVTLTDETRAGLEWFFTNSMSNGVLAGGTKGGLGLGTGGLSLKFTGVDVQAQFNAFASNNQVNILSRPRLVARSGDEARIQVGTDVPIITSRANSPTSTGGSSDILQTIQYRQTGVILRIKPVIYGDGRVDLQITQEVSSQQPNSNAAIGSPLILNRSVTTRLSLDEGATAVIGGLIDDSYTKGNSGIPFLKDIPLVGAPFRVDSFSAGKTELVILVTPHILRDGDDIAAWTQRSTTEMNAAFAVGRGSAYTLTPFSGGQGLVVAPTPR